MGFLRASAIWLLLMSCPCALTDAVKSSTTVHALREGAEMLVKAENEGLDGHKHAVFAGSSAPWCLSPSARTIWQTVNVPGRTVLSKHDVYTCSILKLPVHFDPELVYTRTALKLPDNPAVAELYDVVLLDCDASFWQLSGIQDSQHVCLANTAALRASCNQWLLTPPVAGRSKSESCAPPNTGFGRYGDLSKRVLVLQAHWRMSRNAVNEAPAVQLPDLQLQLGAVPAAVVDGQYSTPAAGQPALLGTFVGSGIYPPSSLSHSLQAFTVKQGELPGLSTAELACGKRCTYLQLGRTRPKPVTVVGYSFSTFDRAVAVAVEVKRGWAGRSAGRVMLRQPQWQHTKAAGGVLALVHPFKLYPGDVVRWRCSYNTSDVSAGRSLRGGYSSAAASLQEQCTVVLHYWPRVEGMRGCSAATADDALLGENMCSNEAEDLLHVKGAEAQDFPMRRMYNEHSFPKGPWMGSWKATHIILQVAMVLAVLWTSQMLLSNCKALGVWHRRFNQLAPGQQRNVSLYIMHLLLDTVTLITVFKPMVELWFGLSETTAAVRTGVNAFTYLCACYALELTWRRRIDTMLAVHHIGTITIIMLYAGEFTPYTYRVANNITVLAAFALMEQPTYVALLCKRMLPAHSPVAVQAARIGYISWFALKGLSVLIAASMFVEDWHIMPNWLRVNFLLTWLVASTVQAWSGFIQYGIYKQMRRSYYKAIMVQQQALGKKAIVFTPHVDTTDDTSSEEGDAGNMSPRIGSDGSEEDCTAAVDDAILGDDSGPYSKHLRAYGISGHVDIAFSPSSSGGSATGNNACNGSGEEEFLLLRTSSRGSTRQVRLQVPEHPQQQQQSPDGPERAGSSTARRQAPGLQRRSKSGLLNLMECGVGSQDD